MHLRTLLGILVWTFTTWSVSAQTLTVVTEEYPPYNYLDANKQVAGLSTEVVKEVLRRAKLDYRINLYPWARAYHMAQEQANVLIYSIGRNAQREALFQWVDIIAPYNVYMYRLKSRPEVQLQKVEQLSRYRIGAVRDDVRAQYLEKMGITAELVVEDSANARKLASQRIDLFPIDEIAMVALYRREGLDPASVEKALALPDLSAGLYMAFSLKTPPELVERCRSALRDMRRDGTLDKIKSAYLR
ncbi:transporter substrate-binding domain-containing protein [Curvibacter sp. APW13]|uniref:substrate-binding periplasmic protein n=1 Tax=Curvibacter sp. APW13 TaxID=3077236 RepID=UPI0028DEFCAD|nr:transporter substrate-binding domain-containing protein [Curvibacter sp. APW13]MDT8989920.1 transporter substrate-binding domain-containing protein [Curvibacter sp. APW13]